MAQETDYRIDTANVVFEEDDTIESYHAVFKKTFRKVQRLLLLYAGVVKSIYQTDGSVAFSFTRGGDVDVPVTMPAGAYDTGIGLAATMQTAIRDAIAAASALTVDFNSKTGKLEIDEAGQVLALTNPVYPFNLVSGFNGTEGATGSIAGTNIIDLVWPRSLGLRVTVQDIPIEGVQAQDYKYSYHIPLSTSNFGDLQEFTLDSGWDQKGNRVSAHPDMDRLKIEWLGPDGVPLKPGAFNGANHELVFRISSMTGNRY